MIDTNDFIQFCAFSICELEDREQELLSKDHLTAEEQQELYKIQQELENTV